MLYICYTSEPIAHCLLAPHDLCTNLNCFSILIPLPTKVSANSIKYLFWSNVVEHDTYIDIIFYLWTDTNRTNTKYKITIIQIIVLGSIRLINAPNNNFFFYTKIQLLLNWILSKCEIYKWILLNIMSLNNQGFSNYNTKKKIFIYIYVK